MKDSFSEGWNRIRGPGSILRIMGALSIALTVAACSGGGGSSWYNPMDWFGSDEEQPVSEGRQAVGETAGDDGFAGGQDSGRLADLVVTASLEPTTSGSILLVNAKSGIPGFHSVRLHRVTVARGRSGDRETLVYEVRGLMPGPDAQTSQSAGDAPVNLSIATFIPNSTLNRNDRIRVIGKQNSIELTI
ncbi:MAG: hypothetical protein OXF56_11945 [Rhodobacteraceae bacterium]|nr:hypothetical protein [Paracoccaceae bacterium]